MTDLDPSLPWRVGRSVGRTIYVEIDDNPDRPEQLIGLMDTPELAELVVTAVNTMNGWGQ